jgi:hypothetical protein
MMKTTNSLLAIALLCMTSGVSSAAWRIDGKLVKDTPWSKADGDFGAQLGLTADPNGLFDAWNKPGPIFAHTETDSAPRGSMIMAFVIFTGCTKNARGVCEVTVHFQAYIPDGKPWSDPQDGELWVGKPPPPADSFELGITNVGVIVEEKDPLGVYKVKAEIRDKVAGRKMILERTFTAIPVAKEP